MRRPNIILITTDQQRTDTLGCYGANYVRTPNLDRLAQEGVLAERAYCANPVCTPARASLFTGRYLREHGAWNVGTNIPDDQVMLSHRLACAGYRTHYVGKAHFQAYLAPPSASKEAIVPWQETSPWQGPYYGFKTVELAMGHGTYGIVAGDYGRWLSSRLPNEDLRRYQQATRLAPQSFGGEAYDWSLPLRFHNSVWTADRTIEFLESHDSREPFFLAVGFQDPHHPHCVPHDLTDRVDPEEVPDPNFISGELDDKPPHFLRAHIGQLASSPDRKAYPVAGQGDANADMRGVHRRDARLGRAYYSTLVQLIDDQIGRILDCLDSLDLTEDTLIVFTSDHGELLGDHGLWMKGPFLYEQLIRVPLLIRWPARLKPGMRVESLLSHVDLTPTILAAVGLLPDERLDGVDALPLLEAQVEKVRDSVLVECTDDPAGLRLKTIVTQTRKLTYYRQREYGELYDLEADPGEFVNRWSEPGYATDKVNMLKLLLDYTEPLERRQQRLAYA
jgi:arylsulfatase A-like enzyme